MKKTWIIIFIIIIVAIGAIFLINWTTNDNNDTNNVTNNTSNYNAIRPTTDISNTVEKSEAPAKPAQPIETELYTFSTPIKSTDENRLTNIKITCSRINKTVVKAGKEFSFCDEVGQPTSEDGYKPADAFGEDGEIIEAIGGGNCQVSTTIYNAALGVKGLKITERHEHNRDVAYVKDGKDATIAYDYLDLKFKNTNDFDIKLYASANKDKVTVKVFKIQ